MGDDAHIYTVSKAPASYHVKLKTSPLSRQLEVFYWENDFFLCFYVSA